MNKDSLCSLKNWNNIFKEKDSDRDNRLGQLSTDYVIPKYYALFNKTFLNKGSLSFLELGAGNGEITKKILENKPAFIKEYVATEISGEGVKKIKERLDIKAEVMSAEEIKYKQQSFDVVCAFDVMHHVSNPKKMAEEMTRVAKKYVFLIEANGLSLGRRLLERKKAYQNLGENSYFPWEYLSFFPKEKYLKITIRPFLFAPPKVPVFLIRPIIIFSELLERIPLLRWQCSGVVIVGEKR